MPSSPLVRVVADPFRAQWQAFAGTSLLAVARIVMDLARPWPLALAVDHAIDGQPAPGWLAALSPHLLLVLAGLATVLLTSASGLLDSAGVAVGERAAERMGARLRADLFEHSMALSLRWHDRIRSGELTSRLTSDVGRVLDAVVAATSTLVPEMLALAGVLVVLVVLDPMLAAVGIVVVPLLAILSVRQRRQVRATQQATRRESGRLSGTTTSLVRSVPAVQAFGRADRAGAEFRARNAALLSVELDAVATEARWLPRADIVLSIGAGLVLVLGGIQVLDSGQTTGHLIVVLAYLRELYAPVRGLTRLSTVLAKAGASAQRIAEILDADEMIVDRPGARALDDRVHGLQLAGVGFGYDTGRQALDGLDLEVRPGEMVCLVGPSGAGKSTLLLLVLRLYDVDRGAVLIDGIDVRSYQVRSLREHIAYVPQDPWLLDATLAQNIAFGARDVTRAGVLEAGRRTLVDEFVDRLPRGYDTHLGEAGARLSGGQRRRVALARAAVSPATLILLDEPTASLDAESARQVAQAIRAATRGRTTLVVSHDPLLVDLADRVVSIEAPASGASAPRSPSSQVGGR